MTKITIGDYNTLRVIRKAQRPDSHSFTKEETFGLYLDGGDDGEILMPQKYVPEGTKVGDEVRAFVYLDQEERPIATTETPLCVVGDFAHLACTWVNEYGAFLSWGVTKDLFCPFREQKKRMEMGNAYIVYVHHDEQSYRLVASAKVEHYLRSYQDDLKLWLQTHAEDGKPKEVATQEAQTADEQGATELPDDFKPLRKGQAVKLLVWQKTDLGFKVIVQNRYAGLIYTNQLFHFVQTGDEVQGYISNIRPDGKIDCALQPTGQRLTDEFAQTLYHYLQDNGGVCHLGDKSDAEQIKRTFHVSKKVFKRAVGDLYKRRLITVEPERIALTD